MSRQYPSHPLPGVLAMVVRDGRLLMVRRAKEPDKGKWGFPGGLVELGETVAAAALRELAEETGVAAAPGPVVDVLDVITADGDGRVRYHFILSVVLCPWIGGDGVAADDAAAVGWFSLDRILDPALPSSSNAGRLARKILETKFSSD